MATAIGWAWPRQAIRALARRPVFSAAVILTLALGLGANSAVFTALNGVLFEPLPYRNADRLIVVEQHIFKLHTPATPVAPVRLADWNRLDSTFTALTGYYTEDESETSGPLPEKLRRAWVAPHFLRVLGVAPKLGRDFTPREATFGGPDAILISYRFWQERFHGAASALGRRLRFGSSNATIVGVMPAGFAYPSRRVDLWSPVPTNAPYALDRRETWYFVLGRLKPGATLPHARANMTLVQRQLGREFPATDADLAVSLTPLKDTVVAGAQRSLWTLYAAVILLLLIVCANVAGLLLTRGAEREPEIALRRALGASRPTLLGQLLLEAGLLALVGAGLGLWLAAVAAAGLRHFAAALPRAAEIAVDGRVVLYTLLSAAVATFLCGAWPAWRATRSGLASALARRTRTAAARQGRGPWALVGAQIALAVLLLSGAGLLLRSFAALGRVAPGFDASHVLSFLVTASYGEPGDQVTARMRRTLATLRALPGVRDAATAPLLPGQSSPYPIPFRLLGGSGANQKITADSRLVSASYFATLGIPLLQGAGCREPQNTRQLDAVVNRAFARRYLASGAAIGRELTTNAFGGGTVLTIRAVAADAHEEGLERAPMPLVYWCDAGGSPMPYFLVRTHGDPAALAGSVRQALARIEPTRAVYDVVPLAAGLDTTLAGERARAWLLGFFAAAAIILACLGLYGTVSFLVNAQRREIGVRLALGAPRHGIVEALLRRGLLVALGGCAAGLLLGVWASRLLAGLLFAVSPEDPATLAAVVLLVLVVAMLAVLAPAWRAARTDPAIALREE